MSPEERRMLVELYQWMQARKGQQIAYPLDEASRNSLGVVTDRGAGSAPLTQSITVGAGGGSFSVPAAFQGTLIYESEGVRHIIPHLGTV